MILEPSFEESFSIAYLGPEGSGVTTSFQNLYQMIPEKNREEWEVLEEKNLLQFQIKNHPSEGKAFHLQCLEAPFHPEALELVFSKVSGIVLVLGSEPEGLEKNLQFSQSVEENLKEWGIEVGDICWLIQYNKRDQERALPLEKLEEVLNPKKHPFAETVATQKKGLSEGFLKIAQLIEETHTKLENQILEGLGESSAETAPVFDPGNFPLLPAQEAMERMKSTGTLEGVAVEILDLSSQTWETPLLIRSCKIGKWNSIGATFKKKLEFRETSFMHEILFSNPENPTRFEEDCTFAHTSFWGDLDFSGTLANSTLRLLHSEVKRGLFSFHRAHIKGNLELTDSTFKKADFRNLSVEGWVRMDPAYFLGPVNFQKSHFHSGAIFTGSSFEGQVRFRESRFESLVDFSGTDFQDEAYFADSAFRGPVEFLKTCFGGPSSFSRVDFQNTTSFRRVRFEAEAVWTGMRCTSSFLLEEAEFVQTANFQEIFLSKGVFQNVKFCGETDFSSSVFQGSANFHETFFESDTYFCYCQFQTRADFKGSKFAQGISFKGMEGNFVALKRSQVEGHLIAEREENWRETSWEYKRLKKIFEDLQAFEDGEWSYYQFRVAERKAIQLSIYRPDGALRRFLEWIFLDLFSQYGTHPASLLWASTGMALLFALVYGVALPHHFIYPSASEIQMNFGHGLAMSVSLFSTNGSLGWMATSTFTLCLMSLESAIGLLMFIMFAIIYMRKMLR